MTNYRADPPELIKAIDMLREIYWREYGRGWRAACAGIKACMEQMPIATADGETEDSK